MSVEQQNQENSEVHLNSDEGLNSQGKNNPEEITKKDNSQLLSSEIQSNSVQNSEKETKNIEENHDTNSNEISNIEDPNSISNDINQKSDENIFNEKVSNTLTDFSQSSSNNVDTFITSNDNQTMTTDTKEENSTSDKNTSEDEANHNIEPGIHVDYNIQPNKEDIESAYNSLINHGLLPVEVHRPYVMKLIIHHKAEALIESDYVKAQQLDEALNLIQNDTKNLDFQRSKRLQQNSFSDRMEILKRKIQKTTEKWNVKTQQAVNASQKRMAELHKTQNQDIENFKKQWQSPEYLRAFNRPSAELNHLRLVEKKLALGKQYAEAKNTKKVADELQAQEEQKMQEIIQEKMKNDFIKLKTRHKNELKKLTDYNQSILKEIELQKNKEIQPIKTAIKQMKVKKDDSLSKKLPRSDWFHSDSLASTLPSPRTSKLIMHYQNEKKAELVITPADDAFFEQLIKSPLNKRSKSSLPPL